MKRTHHEDFEFILLVKSGTGINSVKLIDNLHALFLKQNIRDWKRILNMMKKLAQKDKRDNHLEERNNFY